MPSPLPIPELAADCDRCGALCCIASAFQRSADFAIDKPAGVPCRHLGETFQCRIHDDLRGAGFSGCAVFDCLGAGQRVTQAFGGPGADVDGQIEAFGRMRSIHQLLWLLRQATELSGHRRHPAVAAALATLIEASSVAPAELRRIEPRAWMAEVVPLLRQVSEDVRAASGGPRTDHSGADLAGADLRQADLRGASLRGTWLIGADLRGVDLGLADLTGADLRGADLRGADLSRALFVAPPQLAAARGDGATRLPEGRTRPEAWEGAARESTRGDGETTPDVRS